MKQARSLFPILAILLIISLLATPPARAATGSFVYNWHAFLGSNSIEEAKAVEVDSAGNVIVAGFSLDAWNGPTGQAPLNAFYSDLEITVAKFSKKGAYLWHTFYGAGGTDKVYATAIDPDGRILVTGFSQFGWKGPGNIEPKHAHSGTYDIFVLCLNADGSYAWHTFYGSASNANEIGLAATWDRNNEPVIAGVTDFKWAGESDTGPLNGYTGGDDLFVLKLNQDGSYQWHTYYGSTEQDIAWGVTTDSNNNIYLTGSSYISWAGPLGESPLNPFTSDPADQKDDLLVIRLSPAGNYNWHAFYGSTNHDRGNEIVADSANNLYITGFSDSSWDFPSGPTAPLHAHSGAREMLVMKLVPGALTLTYAWHTFHGSAMYDSGEDLALGPNGLVVGGYSNQSWNGNGGLLPLFPHSGSEEITGLGLTTDGAYQWHTFFGSSSMDEATSVAVDVNGNITLAGWSDASWTAPGGIAPKIAHAGDKDMVVVKINKFQTTTIASTAAQDGYILETNENANTGGTMNTTATTLRLGDDAARKQYRSLLSFPTGALPDNAVITKVVLRLRKQGVIGGGDPVTTFQGFMLDLRKGTFGTAILQTTDFQVAGDKTVGPFKPTLTGGWYAFNLTSARGYINKLGTLSGLTQIRLRFKLDDNNNTTANHLNLYSGNAGAASRPQLIVEYYVP